MAKLIFATRNPGKLVELQELLDDAALEILSLDDIEFPPGELPENGTTFMDNAAEKATYVSKQTGLPALADDSGLLVDALGGEPGVFSARYAGEGATDADNNKKLLEAMDEKEVRSARFVSVLVLADVQGRLQDAILHATGICPGEVLRSPRGEGGFGYDPLFLLPEVGKTFAELGVGPKGQLSHRARAMAQMKPQLIRYFALQKGQ